MFSCHSPAHLTIQMAEKLREVIEARNRQALELRTKCFKGVLDGMVGQVKGFTGEKYFYGGFTEKWTKSSGCRGMVDFDVADLERRLAHKFKPVLGFECKAEETFVSCTPHLYKPPSFQ